MSYYPFRKKNIDLILNNKFLSARMSRNSSLILDTPHFSNLVQQGSILWFYLFCAYFSYSSLGSGLMLQKFGFASVYVLVISLYSSLCVYVIFFLKESYIPTDEVSIWNYKVEIKTEFYLDPPHILNRVLPPTFKSLKHVKLVGVEPMSNKVKLTNGIRFVKQRTYLSFRAEGILGKQQPL